MMTWGLENGNILPCVSLDCALQAEILILPLPVCRKGELNLPLTDSKLSAEELWHRLNSEQILLGGVTEELAPYLREKFGLQIYDYYNREEVQIANAIPTAEGAIMRMMEETEYTVQGSRCLVIGYGRIGKALAHRLQTFGADVTVTARNPASYAWIRGCGYRAIMASELTEKLGEFDVIFNTAPAPVLEEAQLDAVQSDCLLMELASLPGGIDLNAAKKRGLHVVIERGLPGKYAPLSAAQSIRDSIYRILEEQGEWI